jgi:hypothetical protein
MKLQEFKGARLPMDNRLRLNLLNRTVKRYAGYPEKRAIEPAEGYSDGRCHYIMPDGRRCAIGSEVSKRDAEKLENSGGTACSLMSFFPYRLYRLGADFLNEIQRLHDQSNNWDEHGLTDKGERQYNYIIENFIKT